MELEGDDQKASGSGSRGRFKWICVFCGSRSGYKPAFGDAALELGKQLVRRNINLVYGGGSAGLMGLISKTVFDGGCQVIGIIPKAVIPQEISGETIGEVISVADMHERKSEMAKHSDAFIALPGHFDHINCSFPHSCFLLLYLTDFLKTFAITMLSIDPTGGYGTMEELLEMIAWAQLGIHEKPVGLLNVDGYYNSLLALFDKGVEEGFIEKSARQIVVSSDTAEELVRKMEEYSPVHDRVVPRQSWGAVDQLPDPFAHGHASTS